MVDGFKVKRLRETAGLTGDEFGKKVYASQAMIAGIENGIREPGIRLLKRIADYFGTAVDDLLLKDGD